MSFQISANPIEDMICNQDHESESGSETPPKSLEPESVEDTALDYHAIYSAELPLIRLVPTFGLVYQRTEAACATWPGLAS